MCNFSQNMAYDMHNGSCQQAKQLHNFTILRVQQVATFKKQIFLNNILPF